MRSGLFALMAITALGILTAPVFAETIHGENYDLEKSDRYYIWTSAPDRLSINGQWANYKVTDNPAWYKFETANGSIVIDKTSCSIKLMDPGFITSNETPLINSISQVVKESTNGKDSWKSHGVNSQSCEFTAVTSERGVQVTLTRQNMALGIGTKFDTVYDIDYSGNVEATFKYTNNDLTKLNHKYGFSQVFDGAFTVTIGDKAYSTNDPNETDILAADIEGQPITISKDGFQISYDPENYIHDYLWAVKIKHGQIVFDYTFSKGALPVGQTLEVDPTFGYAFASSDIAVISTSAASASCDNAPYTSVVNMELYKAASAVSNHCHVKAFQWDTSSIPDTAIVTTVNMRYEISYVNNPINCDLNEVTSDITIETAANLWSQINTGTTWVDNDSDCTTVGTGKTVTLGAAAATALQGLLPQDRFAVGVTTDDKTRDGSTHDSRFADGQEELQVLYYLSLAGYEIKPEVNRP